jgi:hypothetical protein
LNDDHVPDSVCSLTFIPAFMLRNRFSHQRQHFRRRPFAKPTYVSAWQIDSPSCSPHTVTI